MQHALSNKSAEYQENMSDIAEENVQLKINLEKSSLQIEKLKDEQKRADELLNKAGLMDLSGSTGFDIGRVGTTYVLCFYRSGLSYLGVNYNFSHFRSAYSHPLLQLLPVPKRVECRSPKW